MGHGHATTATGSAAPAEGYAARRHPEYVVLDVGGDYGALIIHTIAELHGVEIEISLDGRDEHRSHKQVLERSLNGSPAYTAVFESLEQGRYTLWTDGVPRVRGVAVCGGEIATVDWTTVAGELSAAEPGQPKR
jgi:hypothetical protein